VGFDSIAKYYDGLTKLVFGNSLAQAQTYFLNHIPPSTHVLVVGGGTGWWMNEFLINNPTCKICFVEESSEMIRLAKKTTNEDHRITFRLGTHNSIFDRDEYDVVIAFCFLDIFSASELTAVIRKINTSTRVKTLWLVTDFVETKWWHSIMLFIMYRFFSLTTGLKNHKLPDWHAALIHTQLVEVDKKLFSNGFIKSALYSR
jgi:tRNA (cmo5U34)-methyltransferase